MRKSLGIPLGVLLMVAGATAVFAQTGGAAGAANPITAASNLASGAGAILGDVLDDLVADGTIDQEQADAIEDAVEQRVTDLREEAERLREEAQRLREQIREFLEDGTLSEDELAQLPEDHPLRNLDAFLDDGQLTEDELRQLGGIGGFGFGRGGHFHVRGFGPGGPDEMWKHVMPEADPDATPDPTPEPTPEAEGSSTSTTWFWF
jgi:hypothetical protein